MSKVTTGSNDSPTTRVGLITGAAQGIGRDIALRLARDGLDVALNDVPGKLVKLEAVRDEILEQAKASGTVRRCVIMPGDVSKEAEVAGIVEQVVKELGGLDVMVANAGIAVVYPLVDMNTDEFDRLMGVNVRGIMLCYKYAARQMIKQGRGGRIVGASSVSGKAGLPFLSAYSASKFAIRGLTQCAALELGRYAITVNTYAPGPILTEMMEHCDERAVELLPSDGMQKGDFLKEFTSKSALGSCGTAADVASLVSYLASEEAHFITGQSVAVDGGLHFD